MLDEVLRDEYNFLTDREKYYLNAIWGEYYLNEALNEVFGAVRYKENNTGSVAFLFDGIHIPSYKGKTREIDSVLVCQRGVFAFEVKSWSGHAIFGEADGEKWFSTKSTGKNQVKETMTGNPVAQNRHHIGYLKKKLPEVVSKHAMFSRVLLIDADPFGIKPGNWAGGEIKELSLTLDECIKSIKDMPVIMSGERVLQCAEILSKFQHSPKTKI